MADKAVTTTEETSRAEVAEPTRDRTVFVPRTDIIEREGEIVLVADMPGVSEGSVDITLEKRVLTIRGTIEVTKVEEHTLAYAEYEEGDYERAFTVSDEVDQEGIAATVKHGTLRVVLPKTGPAKPKKIEVKGE